MQIRDTIETSAGIAVSIEPPLPRMLGPGDDIEVQATRLHTANVVCVARVDIIMVETGEVYR